MNTRPTDGGENFNTDPSRDPYIAESGRCRIVRTGQLLCVAPADGSHPHPHAYILVEFCEGEEHAYDRLAWKNKGGGVGTGYVVRTGDGDANLMPHLWERWCVAIDVTGQLVMTAATVVAPVTALVPVAAPVVPQAAPVVKRIRAKKSRPVVGPGLFEGD